MKLELLPLYKSASICSSTENDVLIHVLPPTVEVNLKTRPDLYLVLAIDNSGSMSGEKLHFAKQAACQVIDSLKATDKIGIVTFESAVKTVAKLELVEDREGLKRKVNAIVTAGSTALCDGWKTSAAMLEGESDKNTIRRVIILSDGDTNVGERSTDAIATLVSRANKVGISTSTMGVGRDYNEDLMEAMAVSGDGNYYFVENPQQIKPFFELELSGAQAQIGRNAKLTLDALNGVVIKEAHAPTKLKDNVVELGGLISGIQSEAFIRLTIPTTSKPMDVLKVTLSYEDKDGNKEVSTPLHLTATDNEWAETEANQAVKERLVSVEAAKKRNEAVAYMESGNRDMAKAAFQSSRSLLESMPESTWLKDEAQFTSVMESRLADGDLLSASKLAKNVSYSATNTTVRESLRKAYKLDPEQ